MADLDLRTLTVRLDPSLSPLSRGEGMMSLDRGRSFSETSPPLEVTCEVARGLELCEAPGHVVGEGRVGGPRSVNTQLQEIPASHVALSMVGHPRRTIPQ